MMEAVGMVGAVALLLLLFKYLENPAYLFATATAFSSVTLWIVLA